jgi:hypothetical protein
MALPSSVKDEGQHSTVTDTSTRCDNLIPGKENFANSPFTLSCSVLRIFIPVHFISLRSASSFPERKDKLPSTVPIRSPLSVLSDYCKDSSPEPYIYIYIYIKLNSRSCKRLLPPEYLLRADIPEHPGEVLQWTVYKVKLLI